jgi:hypothetical protein
MHKQTKAKVCVVIPLSTVLSVRKKLKAKKMLKRIIIDRRIGMNVNGDGFPLILHENWYFLEKPLLISVIVSNM